MNVVHLQARYDSLSCILGAFVFWTDAFFRSILLAYFFCEFLCFRFRRKHILYNVCNNSNSLSSGERDVSKPAVCAYMWECNVISSLFRWYYSMFISIIITVLCRSVFLIHKNTCNYFVHFLTVCMRKWLSKQVDKRKKKHTYTHKSKEKREYEKYECQLELEVGTIWSIYVDKMQDNSLTPFLCRIFDGH